MPKTYIEREALIDYLTKATGHKATCDGCCDIDCVDCIRDEIIKNLPTADVVEVRHGYWKDNHNGTFTCSVCNGNASKMSWCGHCGAKMDRKGDTE